MKQFLFIIVITGILLGCKSESKKELTIAQKIADAHGYVHWNNIKTFHFTFGGNDTIPNSGRSWIWNTKTNEIRLLNNNETISYNRNSMDSVAVKSDRVFINDKFWALFPFQLVWDEGTTFSEVIKTSSPVNNQELNKVTLTYSSEGGYTPGDAYDIFFDDEFIIREWNFRRGNQSEPSISNTFENYVEINGLYLAQEHKMAGSNRNLRIRNIKAVIE